jgi:hypothetical protein
MLITNLIESCLGAIGARKTGWGEGHPSHGRLPSPNSASPGPLPAIAVLANALGPTALGP